MTTHALIVYTHNGPVRGDVLYIKALADNVAEIHISTSGWLTVGSYSAEYIAPKATATGTYAVVGYENERGNNWAFSGVFTRA